MKIFGPTETRTQHFGSPACRLLLFRLRYRGPNNNNNNNTNNRLGLWSVSNPRNTAAWQRGATKLFDRWGPVLFITVCEWQIQPRLCTWEKVHRSDINWNDGRTIRGNECHAVSLYGNLDATDCAQTGHESQPVPPTPLYPHLLVRHKRTALLTSRKLSQRQENGISFYWLWQRNRPENNLWLLLLIRSSEVSDFDFVRSPLIIA
jgi:hypothetical protein